MPSEFELIRQLSELQAVRRNEVRLGIGDDAALLDIPADNELVLTTDTLNGGVHFPEQTLPEDIGYKSLAVNLSDLAAMGATPVAANLSLSLPKADESWLKRFAEGFFQVADQYDVQLVGGDTTRGPLSISVTAMGFVRKGRALLRSGAMPGDMIYVTGHLGDAGAALLALQGELKLSGPQNDQLLKRLNRPEPRNQVGQRLSGLASACIDLSDGLIADLGHILQRSHTGATLYVERLPVSPTLQTCFDLAGGWYVPLSSGDDYELCFTIPESRQAEVESIVQDFDLPITWIGMIESLPGLRLLMDDGSEYSGGAGGYDHFR
ncbi:MAG: thiamine-phosphate kinase [Gammaproteobacteria bacterium]|nr:MAG: thiamine-phosphate kinase [Gammaproteobacteria bacterium]